MALMLAWDGKVHVPYDHKLFKHLCQLHNIQHRWLNRVNEKLKREEWYAL